MENSSTEKLNIKICEWDFLSERLILQSEQFFLAQTRNILCFACSLKNTQTKCFLQFQFVSVKQSQLENSKYALASQTAPGPASNISDKLFQKKVPVVAYQKHQCEIFCDCERVLLFIFSIIKCP